MQKIVFLDFDGVLNNTPWIERNWGQLDDNTKHFDPECVERLNRILALTGADVVLSTSWRYLYRFEDLKVLLGTVGVVANVVGETRMGVQSGSQNDLRYDEIRDWLAANSYEGPYIVLDDQVWPSQAGTEEEAQRILHTSMGHGLMEEHVVAAVHVLGEK